MVTACGLFVELRIYGDGVVSFCVNEFSSTGFNLQRSAWTDKNLNEQTKIQYSQLFYY